MHSGWADYVTDAGKYLGKDSAGVLHFPGFGPDAVEWLLNALAGAITGLLIGGIIVLVVRRFTKRPEELIVD